MNQPTNPFANHIVTYSFLDNSNNGLGEEDLQKYRVMEKKDKRRWKLADADAVGAKAAEQLAVADWL